MTELIGNHSSVQVGRGVLLNCMAPDARTLMDRALECYQKKVDAVGARPGYSDFGEWLLKESGLVHGVNFPEASEKFREHMTKIRRMLKDHPDATFRRSQSRASVYKFAYWFFRWSGMVDSQGNAVIMK